MNQNKVHCVEFVIYLSISGCYICNKYEFIKNIVICFLSIRLKYYAKCENQQIKCVRKRSKLTKLIHFSNQ